jgi:hypothetical protein
MWTELVSSPGIGKSRINLFFNVINSSRNRLCVFLCVCMYICMYVCVDIYIYIYIYIFYYILGGRKGKGNENIRGFLSALNTQPANKHSADTQHSTCTNPQYHALYLTGDPRSCSLRCHCAG